jgi:hypothetical protein
MQGCAPTMVMMKGSVPRREAAVSALPQLPPPCTSNRSLRSFWSGCTPAPRQHVQVNSN